MKVYTDTQASQKLSVLLNETQTEEVLLVPQIHISSLYTSVGARHSGRDAGQIGRTTDLHGSAARRVRDMDVPYASSVQGWQKVGYNRCP